MEVAITTNKIYELKIMVLKCDVNSQDGQRHVHQAKHVNETSHFPKYAEILPRQTTQDED